MKNYWKVSHQLKLMTQDIRPKHLQWTSNLLSQPMTILSSAFPRHISCRNAISATLKVFSLFLKTKAVNATLSSQKRRIKKTWMDIHLFLSLLDHMTGKKLQKKQHARNVINSCIAIHRTKHPAWINYAQCINMWMNNQYVLIVPLLEMENLWLLIQTTTNTVSQQSVRKGNILMRY